MEFDSKCSPLAMLTQACNKIESNLMGEGCPLPSSRRTLSSSSSSTSPSSSAAVNNNNGNLLKSHLKLETFSSGLVARPKSSSTSISSLSPPSLPDMGQECKPRVPSRTPSRASPASSVGSEPKPKSPAKHLQSQSDKGPSSSSPTPKRSPMPTPPNTSSVSLSVSPHSVFSSMVSMPSILPPTTLSAYPSIGAMNSKPCTDPLCRDPSCPTFAMRNAQFYSSQAYAAAFGAHGGAPFFFPGMIPPMNATTTTANSLVGLPSSSPFVCNWVQGADYCGRRFSNSEDLMGHLRSHTSNAVSASSNATLAMLQAAQAQALMPSSHVNTSALAMLQAQASKVAACTPTTSLPPSPVTKTSSSSERHHPYSRPSGVVPQSVGMPSGLGSLPPGFPPHLAAAMFPNPFVPSSMGSGPPPGMIPYPHLLYP